MKLSELPSLKEGALSSVIAGATGYKRPTDNSMVTDFINKASKSIALKIQNGEISTAPTPIGGAGAFGQKAANLAQPSSTQQATPPNNIAQQAAQTRQQKLKAGGQAAQTQMAQNSVTPPNNIAQQAAQSVSPTTPPPQIQPRPAAVPFADSPVAPIKSALNPRAAGAAARARLKRPKINEASTKQTITQYLMNFVTKYMGSGSSGAIDISNPQLQQAIKTEIANVEKTYAQDQGKAALTKLANILYTAAKKSQQTQTASPSKIPQTTLAESKKKVIRNWGIK